MSLFHIVQTISEAHTACHPMGMSSLSLRVKRPVREAVHPPPSTFKVKKMQIYISISTYIFIEWWLIKHRSTFIFIHFLIHYVSRKTYWILLKDPRQLQCGTRIAHKVFSSYIWQSYCEPCIQEVLKNKINVHKNK